MRVPRPSAAPLGAGLPRALLEATAGYAALLALAFLFGAHQPGNITPLAILFTAVAWLWLDGWTAWRLRRIGRHRWWTRLFLGVGRAILTAIALGLIATAIDALIRAKLVIDANPAASFRTAGYNLGGGAAIGAGFVALRLIVLAAARGRHFVRRRLRRQLIVSHALAIALMLVLMTAAGSLTGIALGIAGSRADTGAMAQSIAGDVSDVSPGAVLNRAATLHLLRQVQSGTQPIRGRPPLSALLPQSFQVPVRTLILDPSGRVLAGRRENDLPVTGQSWQAIYGKPRLWARLWREALAGVPFTVSLAGPNKGLGTTSSEIAEAPIDLPSGRLVAIAVVQSRQVTPSVTQLLQGALAVFGAATVVLLILTALPVLALAFLASYLLARNLTRRVESVSAVTTAIAGGDLSRRAPVNAENEIGKLAKNVNLMAANLEASMGELQTARTRAVDALRSRQELVASISHELRTPLAIIRAHLESVALRRPVGSGAPAGLRDEDIPVPPATMNALRDETERLAGLIDDLFALSRADAGAIEVRREPVDVVALVDEIAAAMRPLAWRDGAVTLLVDAPPGLPAALADADRLRQIIANLIRNAVRHTPDGGIIALSVEGEDRWIVLAVADTGEGIPPEHLPHIFERFYRVDEARGRDSGGAGLGLAIVREFVELMGGRVSAESRQGEGSIFRVFLPRVE